MCGVQAGSIVQLVPVSVASTSGLKCIQYICTSRYIYYNNSLKDINNLPNDRFQPPKDHQIYPPKRTMAPYFHFENVNILWVQYVWKPVHECAQEENAMTG